MPIAEFILDVLNRFGIALVIDPWFLDHLPRIAFLPRSDLAALAGPDTCGATVVRWWPDGLRDVTQIWIADPDTFCPVDQLPTFVEHELRHVWEWIVNGVMRWAGHP